MRRLTYHRRTFTHHWRISLAVALGVASGTAALTGALIVGDSMRESLRELALGRLGRADYTMIAQRFFLDTLSDRIAAVPGFSDHFAAACPAILLRGGVTHAELRTRVNNVDVLGVDERFWKFHDLPMPVGQEPFTGRVAFINESLAAELEAKPGDEILLRMGKPSTIPIETLLGRRDETTATLRLTIAGILTREHLGHFSLNLRQSEPRNVFVPLPTLQRAIAQADRANAILVSAQDLPVRNLFDPATNLPMFVERSLTLEDLGLRLRLDNDRHYVSLESDGILIEPVVERTAVAAARNVQAWAQPVLAYLANRISTESNKAGIPYSTIVAMRFVEARNVPPWLLHSLGDLSWSPQLAPDEVMLSQWAADDLGAKEGDQVVLEFFTTGASGQIETRTASFTVKYILNWKEPFYTDAGLVPTYPGLTDANSLADWDAPFPIDLNRIREKDEQYWDEFRTTPKAWIQLEVGQGIWIRQEDRHGKLTSIQLREGSGGIDEEPLYRGIEPLSGLAHDFRSAFIKGVVVDHFGLTFDSIRTQAIQSSQGTTDFGQLFLGFSFFLIISATLLVALLFRLGVERRSSEVGILLATGFTPSNVTYLLLVDGILIASVGTLLGLMGACGYAWLMLAGLRSWWSSAVNTPMLQFHIAPTSLAIGAIASLIVAMGAIAWAVRELVRFSPRALLAGASINRFSRHQRRRFSWHMAVSLSSFLIAVGTVCFAVTLEARSQAAAFFSAGALLLVGMLSLFRHLLGITARGGTHRKSLNYSSEGPGTAKRSSGTTPGIYREKLSITRLGLRNTARYPARSLLTAGLIASATFIIIAVDVFHLEIDQESLRLPTSGTGGHSLYAEAAAPLPYDLSTANGRESLGLDGAAEAALGETRIVPFRLRPGDQASCLSLYRPSDPRILGAPPSMIDRGGFRFSATLAASSDEESNPWTILNKELPDGAIPAIGDAAAVQWQLHSGIGSDLSIKDEQGTPRILRFVALLEGSVLQDEIVIAEKHFVTLFPSIAGQGFFLIDPVQADEAAVEQVLERHLERYSFDAAPTFQRLRDYLAVQNTYLSTFRTLGGLGLVLGTLGLGAVVLRNVWERRRELALLTAVGFDRAGIVWLVLCENAGLLLAGLTIGTSSALLAVGPLVLNRPRSLPWSATAATLALVFAIGMTSSLFGLIPILRTALIQALRSE